MLSYYISGLLLASTSVIASPVAVKSSPQVKRTSITGTFTTSDLKTLSKRGDEWTLPIINNYDTKYGIPLKQWNQQLADNAYKTVMDGHGRDMNHELNPGTFAQVLGPGREDANPSTGPFDPFELIYLGWLCEVSTDAQLEGRCAEAASYSHIDSSGSTGHHDILTTSGYTQIGCAFFHNDEPVDANSSFQGIWGCDLA